MNCQLSYFTPEGLYYMVHISVHSLRVRQHELGPPIQIVQCPNLALW
jgi:hypothetical protein